MQDHTMYDMVLKDPCPLIFKQAHWERASLHIVLLTLSQSDHVIPACHSPAQPHHDQSVLRPSKAQH